MPYDHVSQAFASTIWALEEQKYLEIRRFIARKGRGEDIGAEELEAYRAAGRGSAQVQGPTTRNGVAIIPLTGVIAQKMNMLTEISGGTSTQLFGQAFDAAIADRDVHTIVMLVDSPGGSVFGVQELADKVYAGRNKKPIIAAVDPMAASAAYWIASQAGEVVVTPSGQVGSIGVFTTHEDESEAEKKEGIKTTYISAGKFKTEGNSSEPLSAAARANLQAMVDTMYGAFVNAVARGRRTTSAGVEASFGQGRMKLATAALASGMIDRIATFEQVMNELTSSNGRAARGPAAIAGTSAAAGETTMRSYSTFAPGTEAIIRKLDVDEEEWRRAEEGHLNDAIVAEARAKAQASRHRAADEAHRPPPGASLKERLAFYRKRSAQVAEQFSEPSSERERALDRESRVRRGRRY